MRRRRSLLTAGVLLILVLAGGALVWRRQDFTDVQARRMAAVMNWHAGETVAEIGAGDGSIALLAARRVGPAGRVYANEIEPQHLLGIKAAAEKRGLRNVTPVEGAGAATNLPDDCCDAIYMRWVYHHFTDPANMDRSLFRALHTGGLLVIADFEPTPLDRLTAFIKDHPVHGVSRDVVRQEVTAAGFLLERDVAAWPGKGYCILFRKPPNRPPAGGLPANRTMSGR